MAKDTRLKKFVQVLPSLPKRDINGNIIEGEFTEKETLWGWFFPIEDYWTKTETQTKLNELEQKIYESIDWKETVNTYSEIATKYPNPNEGWTVSVKDTNAIYRYDDTSKTWIKILESSTELATESINGLMSAAFVKKLNGIEEDANNYIHPTTHPGSMITEDANHRWLTDTLINKLNALVSFPGFAGTGGYYGTSANAARYDHKHQTLTDLTLLKFVNNMIIDICVEDGQYFQRITTVNSVTSTDKKLLFQEHQGSGGYINLFGIDSNGDIYGGKDAREKVSFEGHKHAMSDITDLSLDWSAILNKPETITRWPSWSEVTGKPNTFTPESHNHNSIVLTDSRSIDYIPYDTELVKGITGTHLKQNTVDGLNDGGIYHSSIYIHPWNDSSEGAAHNLAFTDNGNMWLRSGTSKWDSWKRIAMLSVVQKWTAYQDFASGAGNSGSDMRFKTKLSDSIGNILDKLLDIEIFPYIWNKEGEQKRNTFGVNATQLKTKQGIFEKIVHEREDEEKTEWVEYDRIGVLALKGLQEEVIQRREENKKLTKVLKVICDKIGIDMNKILKEF